MRKRCLKFKKNQFDYCYINLKLEDKLVVYF